MQNTLQIAKHNFHENQSGLNQFILSFYRGYEKPFFFSTLRANGCFRFHAKIENPSTHRHKKEKCDRRTVVRDATQNIIHAIFVCVCVAVEWSSDLSLEWHVGEME